MIHKSQLHVPEPNDCMRDTQKETLKNTDSHSIDSLEGIEKTSQGKKERIMTLYKIFTE